MHGSPPLLYMSATARAASAAAAGPVTTVTPAQPAPATGLTAHGKPAFGSVSAASRSRDLRLYDWFTWFTSTFTEPVKWTISLNLTFMVADLSAKANRASHGASLPRQQPGSSPRGFSAHPPAQKY